MAGWGAAAAVHYHRANLTLAHFDARAHLVVSRRIFDSLMPGWQQVGAVWLPLPHLLNALPVQLDWLYRTGYSAVALSIASMVVAAWAICTIVHLATGSSVGGLLAAALLLLNPDVLYLQSTPMTEPLLFGATFLAVALVGRWAHAAPSHPARSHPAPSHPAPSHPGPSDPARSHPAPSRPLSSYPPRSTVAAGWACVAAVLTRFEAWPVIFAAIGLASVVLLRRGSTAGGAFRAVRGLFSWPLWAIAAFLIDSKITVGSWFVSSGFFVPDNPAMHHPWLAWVQVWDGLARLSGPVVAWGAVAAASAIAVTAVVRASTRGPLLVVLALAASAVLPWSAYLEGHPVRIRYAVPLVAAAAALIGSAVALLPRRIQPVVAAAAVVASLWHAAPFDPRAPVVIESRRDALDREGRRAVTRYVETHWDGQPIMMSMGALAHYMHDLSASGLRVRDFLHEGTGELWKYALRGPRPYAEWIVIQEKEDRDALYWRANADPRYLEGYRRVAEGGGVALYRLKSAAD